jgi:RNA polymerase sigma-70 factor, ECF subfamily
MTENEPQPIAVTDDGEGAFDSSGDARDDFPASRLETSIAAADLTRALIRDMAGLQAQLSRVTGNADLASDLLQDAVVTALQKLHAGQLSGREALDGFVYRTALNHLRNYRRKMRSRMEDAEGLEILEDPHVRCQTDSLASAEWARVARDVLRGVAVRDRELLVRFYLNDEPKETLCQEYGLTDLHFNRVIFRARERFRELLSRRGLGRADFLSLLIVF